MERYSIDYIVSFLWDGDVLEQRKIKQPIREIGASPMSSNIFTIIYGLPIHGQQLGLEGPIQ